MWCTVFQVTIPQSERHDTEALYTKLRIRELQIQVPEVNNDGHGTLYGATV